MAAEMDTFLDYALQIGASDLILAEGLVPAVRIMGRVRAIPEAPVLAFGDLEKLTGPLEAEAGCFRGGPWCQCLWRVRYSREAFGKMAVLHLLMGDCPDMGALGAPDAVMELLGLGSGLVLFTGIAGSGKTTTASAYVSALCRQHLFRARFLDLICEYDIPSGESLVHYGRPGRDLEEELRLGLLAGTDLFWLGDVPGNSLIPLLRAAEAGSLVVGCMTAGNSAGALDHLFTDSLEQDVLARTLLSSTLKAIVSQRLIPAADGKSMVCAWEVLYNNQSVAALIRNGEHYRIPSLIHADAAEGMLPFDDSLAELVKKKQITQEEARKYALDASRLA